MTSFVKSPRTHRTEHTITINAPARAVYELISDVGRWPHTFPSTVYAERVRTGANDERVRLWTVADGTVHRQVHGRVLDPAALRVAFRHEVSSVPVTTVGGEWQLVPLSDGSTWVVLLHDFRTTGDDQQRVERTRRAIDSESTAQLAALKYAAELGGAHDELVLTFSQSVLIDSPPAPVYGFLCRAGDGSAHTSSAVRVCLPNHSIVYKHLAPQPMLAAHTGRWVLHPTVSGVKVMAQQTVVIRQESIAAVLGPEATVADARDHVVAALAAEVTVVLRQAKRELESRAA